MPSRNAKLSGAAGSLVQQRQRLAQYQTSDAWEQPSAPPEQQLAAAVLLRAVLDVLGVGTADSSTKLEPYELDQARSFCIATHGRWKRDREFWCLIAGIDPDYMRERVTALLAAGVSMRRRYRNLSDVLVA